MKTAYITISELTKLQQDIMHIIIDWVHTEKTPIPLKEIMERTKEKGVKAPTAVNAINGLLNKGYLRRACIISNRSYFVMLRTI